MRPRRSGFGVVGFLVVTTFACGPDNTPSGPFGEGSRTSSDSVKIRAAVARELANLQTYQCTINQNTLQVQQGPPCHQTPTTVPAFTLTQSWDAHQGTITLTFAAPVYNALITGIGEMWCAGSVPTIDYTGPQNSGSMPLPIMIPEDCGFDQTTGYVLGSIPGSKGVTTIVFHPQNPFEWDAPYDPGNPNLMLHHRGGMSFEISYNLSYVPPAWGPLTNNCPTGDSVLDLQATRDLLAELWLRSNANDPLFSNRRERHGWVYLDSLTSNYDFHPQNEITDGPCNTGGGAVGIPGTAVLHVHVHPAAPNETTICNPSTPSVQGTYSLQCGGPSCVPDYNAAANNVQNGLIADVIMDAAWLYKINPGATALNFTTPGFLLTVPRHVLGQCSRP